MGYKTTATLPILSSLLKRLGCHFLCCAALHRPQEAGEMAAAWLSSLTLLFVAGYAALAGSSLVREGTPRKEVGTQGAADEGGTVLARPQKWEWKTASRGGHELPLVSRRRREDGAVPGSSAFTKESHKKGLSTEEDTAAVSASLKFTSKSEVAKPSLDLTTAAVARGKSPLGGEAAASEGVTHWKTPKEAPSFLAPKASGDTSKAASAGAKDAGDRGHPFVPKGIPAATQDSSGVVPLGKESPPRSLTDRGKVSATTEYWPWLYDRTSDTPQMAKEGVDISTLVQRLAGKEKGKDILPFKTTAPSPTTGWPWIRGQPSASSLTLADNLDVSTATLEEETDTHQPVPRAKGKSGSSARKPTTTSWLWLDEVSTLSSQTLVEEEDFSTATPRQILATEKTAHKGKSKADSGSRTAIPSTTNSSVNPPLAMSPRGGPDLLGKCLLAISLLALVAAIFIVITTILAVVLWRRARAYRKNAHNHTEMVCISSLLAAEEAEEAQRKQPRVKRVKMLGESNGLEAETDSLTLNSFLPEH